LKIDNGATASGGSVDQRTNEYLPYPDIANEPSVPNPQGSQYPEFLVKEVMPAVAQRYRIDSGAANTGIAGSSYGGLAALYAVIHRPGIFGRLFLESTPTFMANGKIMEEAERLHLWPARVHIGIGTKETPEEKLNQAAVPAVQRLKAVILKNSPGSKVDVQVGDGDTHDAAAWGRRLPKALQFLWPRG